MKLSAYRQQAQLTLRAFADLLNQSEESCGRISPSMVDRWEKGTTPRRNTLKLIERATTGQVTVVDFYTDDEAPKRKPRATAINVAAARKAAAVRQRRREARP